MQLILQAIAAIKKNQEILEAKAQMKKAAQSKQTEAAKRMLDLRKGKQDLLDKQLAEQKKLIAKLESKKENGEELKVEEKTMIMKLIKTLSESIMKTKDDLQKMIHASTNKLSPSEVRILVDVFWCSWSKNINHSLSDSTL